MTTGVLRSRRLRGHCKKQTGPFW